MEVFRITTPEYGNSLYASGRPNRWNKQDQKVIYTAGSRSLACLENVVHTLGKALKRPFVVMVIYVPDTMKVEEISLEALPDDWHLKARPRPCQELGDEWYIANRSAVLRVPSTIIHQEWNYVLNTKHPDFGRIQIVDQHPFLFDHRLIKPGF